MKKTQNAKPVKIPLYTKIPAWIIAVFLTALPLLILPVTFALTESEITVIPNSNGLYTDGCLRFREIILFLTGLTLLLFWFGERIFPDAPIKSPLAAEKNARILLICCGAYLLLAVISALLSEYPEVSFWGIASNSEGLAAVFGYVALFLAAYNWLRGDNRRLLEYGVLGCGGVVSLLFIVERITATPVGQLITGIEDNRAGISLLFGNSNACGVFCVILFPVLFLCGAAEKRLPLRIAHFLVGGVLLCVIVSSRSSATLVGIVLAVVLLAAVLILRRKKTDLKRMACSPLVLLPLVIMLIADPQGTLKSMQTQAQNSGTYDPAKSCGLRDIEITDSDIRLECESCNVTISLTGENTCIVTGTDGEILANLDNSAADLEGEYAPISVSLNERLLVLDLGYKDTIEFETTGGQPVYIGLNGYLVPSPSQSAFPELSRYYRFGTGRGYIWLNSLPLLKNCIIKGVGADEFVFYFPQDDIVGMLNTHGTTALCTDKPHCMYLGIAISHGIPALLVFLCLAVTVLLRGLGKENGLLENGLLIAVLSGLVMALATDGNATWTPLLWMFAGTVASAKPAEPAKPANTAKGK